MDIKTVIQLIAKHDNISYEEAEKNFNEYWDELNKECKPLDGDMQKFIDENFWDLV